jgi:hypothetical protein
MADFHVTKPEGSDVWHVVKENSGHPSVTARTQAEAEKLARDLALRSGGGEVVIHTASAQGIMGTIRDSNTIGKKDPFPPRG